MIMTRRQASSASQTTPKMLCLPCDSYPVILSFLECIAYVVLSHKEWSIRLIHKNCTELSCGGRTYFIDTPPLNVGCGIEYRMGIRAVHIGLKPGKTKHVLQNYEDAMQHLYKLSSSLQSLRVTYPCITLGLSRQSHKSAESYYTPELTTIQRGLEQFLGVLYQNRQRRSSHTFLSLHSSTQVPFQEFSRKRLCAQGNNFYTTVRRHGNCNLKSDTHGDGKVYHGYF